MDFLFSQNSVLKLKSIPNKWKDNFLKNFHWTIDLDIHFGAFIQRVKEVFTMSRLSKKAKQGDKSSAIGWARWKKHLNKMLPVF